MPKIKDMLKNLPPQTSIETSLQNASMLTEDFINASIIKAEEIAQKRNFEIIPRHTLIKLVKTPIDHEFIFYVPRFQGENYLQCMRQVLSRARAKHINKGAGGKLPPFKLYKRAINILEDCDEVVVMRSLTTQQKEATEYSELLGALMGPTQS